MVFSDKCMVFDLKPIADGLADGGATQVQFGNRIEDELDLVHIGKSAEITKNKTVKSADYLAQVNELCRQYGDKLNVRFYAHYSDCFDGEILKHLPDVQSLTLNCLDDAKNLEHLNQLKSLKALDLGVFDLNDKDILSKLPLHQLEHFMLEEMRTKAVDLSPLAEATRLKTLKLYGHKKNIEVLSKLNGLHEFVFNPAKTTNLDFINRMRDLRALKFVLGGMENFDNISLPHVEQLAVTRVRGLKTLGDLGRFPKLKQLIVQDQIQIGEIVFTSASSKLENIVIDQCKTLAKLEGLGTLKKLKSLWATITALDLEQIEIPKSLTHLQVSNAGVKAVKKAEDYVRAMGLKPEMHKDMPFFYK